jgi:hypothetical protein
VHEKRSCWLHHAVRCVRDADRLRVRMLSKPLLRVEMTSAELPSKATECRSCGQQGVMAAQRAGVSGSALCYLLDAQRHDHSSVTIETSDIGNGESAKRQRGGDAICWLCGAAADTSVSIAAAGSGKGGARGGDKEEKRPRLLYPLVLSTSWYAHELGTGICIVAASFMSCRWRAGERRQGS